MSDDERQHYLAGLHVGVVAVERPDRAPLAVPVWYDYRPDGDVTLFTTVGSVKEKAIRAAGRFSITAQDEQPPYKYVTAEGDVTEIATADDAEERRLAVRYLGEADGNAFADQNAGVPTVVVRMRPRRWLSTDYSKE